jgi:hypothetical protein
MGVGREECGNLQESWPGKMYLNQGYIGKTENSTLLSCMIEKWNQFPPGIFLTAPQ